LTGHDSEPAKSVTN